MAMAPVDKLAMMANQIAQFFKAYPHNEAVAGTASHIEAFWTPRMRETLRAAVHERSDLDPIVIEAFSPEIEAQDPAEKADMGPGRLGELGAVDAG